MPPSPDSASVPAVIAVPPGVGIGCRQHQRAATRLDHIASFRTIGDTPVARRRRGIGNVEGRIARDRDVIVDGVAAGKAERRAFHHRKRAGAECPRRADDQRTGIEFSAPRIAVVAGKQDGTGTILDDRARSGDRSRITNIAGTVENQRAIIGYIAPDGPLVPPSPSCRIPPEIVVPPV